MITCSKCGKENQDHYKFCLGCGAELPRGSAQAKPFSSNTPPHGVPAVAAPAAAAPVPAPVPTAPAPAVRSASQPAPAPSPSAPPGAAAVSCPQCGHVNTTGNRF
ncbi:MAG TPA: zinc-ribbon domain-containing protein, partial [Polyangiaceae bacterium]